jgi:phosphoesterase RecJ-like protein
MTPIQIQSILIPNKKIVITTHKSPDGDALGSSLALQLLLQKKQCEVNVVVPNDFPDFLNWLPQSKQIINAEKQPDIAQKLIEESEIIFCLDYNALSRIEGMENWVEKSKAFKIMIDHHQRPEEFTDFCISDTSKSSTCEMIYDFIEFLGYTNEINENIAECIYCGLVTDTGSFRHPGTSARTHQIVAQLISKGLNNSLVHQKLFDNNSVSRIKVLGYCLNSMEIVPEIESAIFSMSEKTAQDLNMKKGDSEGVVNFGLSISTVKCAAFFREDDGKIKISFRSKNDLDVSFFAQEHFEGGGHKNAAGGMSMMSMTETIAKFKKTMLNYIQK